MDTSFHVIGGWRKIQNGELRNFVKYIKLDQVKEIRMVGSTNGRGEQCLKDVGRKVRMKETTRKTRDGIGWCGLDLSG
jgi:hypothetical protein